MLKPLNHNLLLGAAAGDVMGSLYERRGHAIKTTEFPLLWDSRFHFTDDTVMTVANAAWLLGDGDLKTVMLEWGRKYPHAGWGGSFRRWLRAADPQPYDSWGNGSAMRVSPVGWAFETMDETLKKAEESAAITHNHPEGIKGAQATAAAIFMARNGKTKEEIRDYIEREFGYDLHRTVDAIRPTYKFSSWCQSSVPESIICFLEGTDYESTVRLAISLGGDADTQAAIAGSIAEAYYGEMPQEIVDHVTGKLPEPIRLVLQRFYDKFMKPQA